MSVPLPFNFGEGSDAGSYPMPPTGPTFPKRIIIVTDAWTPQMNGVVRTLTATVDVLRQWGHKVGLIVPGDFKSLPCPTYPDIRLAFAPPGAVARRISCFGPDFIHIATEGPLGLAARRYCLKRGVPFTTAYHTQFPDYVSRRTGIPAKAFWPFIRWFHGPASRIMVATETVSHELASHGLTQIHRWSRGVDLACFGADAAPPTAYEGLTGPIQLYVGRVAVEKNLEAFLGNRYPGTNVVVGDGPSRARLERQFPGAVFLGKQTGRALAGCYAGADVFVFPSKTDTFGLVMIEALACGTPVAAYPVAGPVDIVTHSTGALADDLARAVAGALFCHSRDCVALGEHYSWEAATRQFVDGLAPSYEPDAGEMALSCEAAYGPAHAENIAALAERANNA